MLYGSVQRIESLTYSSAFRISVLRDQLVKSVTYTHYRASVVRKYHVVQLGGGEMLVMRSNELRSRECRRWLILEAQHYPPVHNLTRLRSSLRAFVLLEYVDGNWFRHEVLDEARLAWSFSWSIVGGKE